MGQKSYLEHNFPVILHTAVPAALTPLLQNRLNAILPRLKAAYSQVILEHGDNLKSFRLFNAHHLAVVVMPDVVVLCLDPNGAALFMGAFYCFELKEGGGDDLIAELLHAYFDLKDVLLLKIPRPVFEKADPASDAELVTIANAWYQHERERIKMNTNAITIVPRVFRKAEIAIRKDYCFVIMPFKDELREVYEDGLAVAVRNVGMQCKRADDIFHAGAIMEVIWTEICSAELIIADLTGKNPNVFYELGIAHTLGKNVIMVTQSADDVPFDLRHLRYFLYTNTGRGLQDLRRDLELTISGLRGDATQAAVHR